MASKKDLEKRIKRLEYNLKTMNECDLQLWGFGYSPLPVKECLKLVMNHLGITVSDRHIIPKSKDCPMGNDLI